MKNYDELCRRYKEHDPSLPIYANIGDEVWKAGDAFDWTKKVTVVESYREKHGNDKAEELWLVNAFWGAVYFGTKEEAEKVERQAKIEYGHYQELMADEYYRNKKTW